MFVCLSQPTLKTSENFVATAFGIYPESYHFRLCSSTLVQANLISGLDYCSSLPQRSPLP